MARAPRGSVLSRVFFVLVVLNTPSRGRNCTDLPARHGYKPWMYESHIFLSLICTQAFLFSQHGLEKETHSKHTICVSNVVLGTDVIGREHAESTAHW